ncbi:hypothetical protein SAVCW2_57150 [Streptomyces avermitilis]|nr:hypothetical protein SAVCW2_57150 [Streptomyces avermitilis]
MLWVIQAIGLTSNPRKDLPPVVDDVSFEAHAGRVTALLGTPGAGKTTALRLMLELQQGRGITYFRGRPLHRIAHPSREVGVLLGDVPGHPARTVRGQLRMLCAAAGVPVRRADEVLEVVGLVSLRDERLSTLSRGMDRRLGLACALLADPHTLVLDAPADGLSAREGRWLHGLLRAHATQGGTVLFTTDDPREAAQTADQVVTLEAGRLVADQEAADFARTRLRPRVAVRSPHAARLGALLAKEARTGQRSVEIVREDGNRLSVYGSTCADVGETAFRHGILVHQLADETGDMGAAPDTQPTAPPPRPAGSLESEDLSPLPPPISVRQAPSPLRPLRYELRRAAGVGTGYVTAAAVLIASALIAVILARIGHTPQHRLLAAWPQDFPLPPRRSARGCSGRSPSATSSATPPWPRIAAPSPAAWGCSPRNSSSPGRPRCCWPSLPWGAISKCSTSSTDGSSPKFPPTGFPWAPVGSDSWWAAPGPVYWPRASSAPRPPGSPRCWRYPSSSYPSYKGRSKARLFGRRPGSPRGCES